jgi:choline dehydrogenase-like flavoprotein
LSTEKDEYGIPNVTVTFSYGENDLKLIDHAVKKNGGDTRSGRRKTRIYYHGHSTFYGGCRTGNDPNTSVVNGFCQSHDIPNLFICSASVFITSGEGNPTETVMAIAARTADYILDQAKKSEL